jgi:hypothetical protein
MVKPEMTVLDPVIKSYRRFGIWTHLWQVLIRLVEALFKPAK